MCGTQLVSPAWNQARPWLTGSWLVAPPAELAAEAGQAPGAAGLPGLDLAALSLAEQEAVLVDDLLNVFMGQAGQFVTAELLEGPTWPRLGLRVVGVADAGLLEQVRAAGSGGAWDLCMHARVHACT